MSSQRIRELNDAFRKSTTSDVHYAGGAANANAVDKLILLSRVRSFADFNDLNDPNGEHDFGSFEYQRERYFWKIDYYDLTLQSASVDPADPAKTRRVLTIILASDY